MSATTSDRLPISAIILTYNEEANIEACLRSVCDWVSEIFIVDSGSTDRTLNIARRYTDRIVIHEFVNQAQQLNWALDHLPLQGEWVMRLDADEFVLPELRDELFNVLPDLPEHVTGLYMKRRIYFKGRWIRHGAVYPTWMLRIFRRGKGRSELREMDEHVVLLEGTPFRLRHDFADFNRKDLSFWTIKHEQVAAREAKALLNDDLLSQQLAPNVFGEQPERKRWLKNNVYARAPLFLRAFAYFAYRYFLRLGFLDGPEGLMFHFLQGCWYRFYVDAKLYEMQRADKPGERLSRLVSDGEMLV